MPGRVTSPRPSLSILLSYFLLLSETGEREYPAFAAQTQRSGPTGACLVPVTRSLQFSLQSGQGFVIHVPLFQDGKNRLGSEAYTNQLAEDAGCLFLVLRLRQALAV